MSGNLYRRRMLKFMPADFRLIEYRQPPLKDMYDEWLARITSSATLSPSPPRRSCRRLTARPARRCACRATQEGLVPLKSWIKSALDQVIEVAMNEPDLEFVSRRRRRHRPAAAGPDAQHFVERGD
jgi:hypothetical protein